MIALAVVTLLVLANGLFVAAELSLVAAPRAVIDRFVAEGDRRAREVARILDDPRLQDRYIATAQLGITAASLGLGMYGEHALAAVLGRWLAELELPSMVAAHGLASAISLAALTTLHIVLGEMVPKALALVKAERTAFGLVACMRVAERVMHPVILVLNALGNALLSVVGVARARAREHLHTPEELRFIVRESGESGLLPSEAAAVVEDLLVFTERTAREVMVPRVQIDGIALDATVEELAAVVEEAPRTRYPIYSKDLDHVLGGIHIKALLPRLREGKTLRPTDVRPVPFVPETATLDDVLRTMRERRAHMVIVMDEHGGTAGLITIADLFAEVLGELGGVPDADVVPVEASSAGEAVVAGTLRVDQLGELFGRSLEHEDVDTVSGLVLAELGRPPRPHDAVEFGGLRLEVLEVEGHGVAKCRVVRVDGATEIEKGPVPPGEFERR